MRSIATMEDAVRATGAQREKTVRSRQVSVVSASRSSATLTIQVEELEEKLLYSYHELPAWQKDNELILTGYVRETQSWKKCLLSLSYLNNESINIYTHLVPAVTYFCLLLFFTDYLLIPSFPSTSKIDYLVIDLYLLGAFLCLACSSCFHCLKQHSETQSDIWSKMDYMGIIVLISCSLISLLYYGYFDLFFYFKLFTVVTLVLATICTVCVLSDTFNKKEYRPYRALFFILFSMSGIFPILAGFTQYAMAEVFQRIQLKMVLWEVAFYFAGALAYGCRIPEKFAPGRFDFFGHSHQIFHIMVVLGSIFHLKAIIGSYVFLHSSLNGIPVQRV